MARPGRPRKSLEVNPSSEKCPFCNELTTNLIQLGKHINTLHKEEAVALGWDWCPYCDTVHFCTNHLKAHITRMHSDKSNKKVPKPRRLKETQKVANTEPQNHMPETKNQITMIWQNYCSPNQDQNVYREQGKIYNPQTEKSVNQEQAQADMTRFTFGTLSKNVYSTSPGVTAPMPGKNYLSMMQDDCRPRLTSSADIPTVATRARSESNIQIGSLDNLSANPTCITNAQPVPIATIPLQDKSSGTMNYNASLTQNEQNNVLVQPALFPNGCQQDRSRVIKINPASVTLNELNELNITTAQPDFVPKDKTSVSNFVTNETSVNQIEIPQRNMAKVNLSINPVSANWSVSNEDHRLTNDNSLNDNSQDLATGKGTLINDVTH